MVYRYFIFYFILVLIFLTTAHVCDWATGYQFKILIWFNLFIYFIIIIIIIYLFIYF